MTSEYIESLIMFYSIGFLFNLAGFVLIIKGYSTLDYAIIGIGLLFIILGVNETTNPI